MNVLLLLGLLSFVDASSPADKLDQVVKLYENGEYGKAVDLLSPMLEMKAPPAAAIYWIGKSQLKKREWDKAVEAMERAVDLEPSNAMYHLWLGRAYGARAENRFMLGAYSDAKRVLKEFRKASQLAPGDIGIRFDLLEFYVQANAIVGGDEEKAWAEAEAIAQLDSAVGYTARATIYERKEKWDLAEKEYRKGIEKYPHNPNLQRDLAQFLFSRGNYGGALEAIQYSLELDSQSKQARFLEAACQINLIRINIEKAGNNLHRLAINPLGDEDPAREDVYYWQGVLYDLTGNKIKAKDTLEKTLLVNPSHEMAKEYLKKHF